MTCQKAKQHRTSFCKSFTRAENPSVLIHMDLWGPYETPSLNGNHYILTFVDDHHRAVWTILLPNKHNLCHIIEHFILNIQNQFNTNIKLVRTDNGIEFLNISCQHLFNKSGIEH